MPAFDYPLEKLKTYQGQSPRPGDFDAYWEKALDEMKAVDADLELIPAEFKTPVADCYHMRFTGVGGARIYAKLLVPKNAKPKSCPGLCFFHGYSGASGQWTDYVYWAASGFVIAALDCRGQAGLSEEVPMANFTMLKGHIVRGLREDPSKLAFRSIFLDTAQLAGLVMDMPEVDPERVGALGGSQGGALTLVCAALEPRIAKAAPAYPFLSDYYRVWQMDLAKDAYEELRTFFRQQDPLHEKESEIFHKLGYIDIQNLMPRVKASTLMAATLMDTICPPSTQFAAYNKIESPKEVVVYMDHGHEGLPEWNDKVYKFFCEWIS